MSGVEKILPRDCCILICVAVNFLSSIVILIEYGKFSYVPTYCFVKTSSLRECSKSLIRDDSILKRCFLPVWLIEHNVSGKTKQATIIGSEFSVDYDDVGNDTTIMKLYEVFILTCKKIKSLLPI
jgi:hypothetical protein